MISCRELGTGLVLRLRVPLLRSAIALLTVAAFGGVASAEGTSSAPRVEQRTATAIADAFNDAIARGDSAAARALLMPRVLIFESGDAERSADEYSRHHLLSDIEFMARMQIEQLSRNADGDQTTSWVATKSRMRGHYKGKAVDLDSTETLVLTRTSAGWRIAHINAAELQSCIVCQNVDHQLLDVPREPFGLVIPLRASPFSVSSPYRLAKQFVFALGYDAAR